LTQMRSQILLPYADQNEKGWQPGFINLAADPLGKHTLMTAITYGQRLHFFVDYTCQQFAPTFGINMSKTTIDHGAFLTIVNDKNTITKVVPLYENFWSGTVSLNWNINFGRSLLSNHFLRLSLTATYRDIINAADYKNIDTKPWVYPMLQGWTNYLTLSYIWQTYRPDVSYDIHPKSGWWFNFYIRHADRWLGSDLKYSQLGLAGVFRREFPLPEHVIAIRGGVSFRTGDQPIQSRLAIGDNFIRGLSHSQEGDQQLYGNFEYRFPFIRDLGLKIWILYFERFCGALFLDTGTAWGNQLENLYKLRYQSFKTAPWLTTTGLELRHRLYIFGKIAVVVSGGYAIDVSATDLSNFYFRMGSVF
jgi:outer membrane protein assembly factor BamA